MRDRSNMPSIRNRVTVDDSRRSGPVQQAQQVSRPPSTGSGKEKGKDKTFMDRWVEPSLAAPKPSYQDHGAGPYGVLEHMQPLGEVPSAKVKARAKGDGSRKSVLGRSSAAPGADAQETPEGTPAPTAGTPQPMDLPVQQPVVIDDERDADYAPTANGKKKERATRTRAVKRKSESTSSATPAAQPPQTIVTPHKKEVTFEYDGEKLLKVVEAAKARAREVGKPDLADAVHAIYLQSLETFQLRVLLEAILTQRATPEQNAEFQQYVRAAKKKLKDAKLQSRHQPGKTVGDGTIEKTSAIAASPTPKLTLNPAPHRQTGTSSAIPSTERQEPTKPRISLKVKSPHKDPNRHRSHHGKVSVSPRKRERANSNASDSSLTDLTSNDGEDDMDVDQRETDGDVAGPSTRTHDTNVKDLAAERGSLAVPGTAAKRSSAEAELEQERDREMAAKKQRLSGSVKREFDFEESNVRPSLSATRLRGPKLKANTLAPPSLKLEPNASRTASVRGSRAPSMDVDSPLSALSSPATSRQSTPRVWQVKPKPKQRAKTKQSPEKKQQVASSGMSGVGGARRESPIGDDDNEELGSENQDYCSACGGSGYLLCCDGCDRSFHFGCVDPPLNPDAEELDEPWYCNICVAKRPVGPESPEKPTRGLFAPLFGSLKKRNPTNFNLPEDIRAYFEGVSSDKNGGFVESMNATKNTRSRPGYSDDQPDYYRLRDNKGNLVLCYACGKSSHINPFVAKRSIVSCDHCMQHWHLDCLDPPLANPPALNQNGKKVHDWMCPLHADQELRRVDTALLNRHHRRTVHLRKPRVPKVQETALSRGSVNNGIIDVAEDASDESDSEFYEEGDEAEGTIMKLPARGIMLDFIDKVKSTRVQQYHDDVFSFKRGRLAENNTAAVPSALKQANFARRPFNEKQLALQLTQFASENKDFDLGSDRVENLVGTLIAEAPSEVVTDMMSEETRQTKSASSAVPPSPPASEQTEISEEHRRELEMLRDLINRKLDGAKS
ncbi:hypothetical protein DOTSEDRAFT_73191 [Dothistroma septosporum NZE10]|uniref:PHD-type domain-containing protein n=1 Tax=Dothistroma septosporum (strain NZE10 / CBS 128990) TaxID=675120 RepID=N1PIR9_DOTSN|nr:hypothetical protein DOTSEDRAFT_73191 [Dothistroma septosporum NZE10]